jgi:hypothetical protein
MVRLVGLSDEGDRRVRVDIKTSVKLAEGRKEDKNLVKTPSYGPQSFYMRVPDVCGQWFRGRVITNLTRLTGGLVIHSLPESHIRDVMPWG